MRARCSASSTRAVVSRTRICISSSCVRHPSRGARRRRRDAVAPGSTLLESRAENAALEIGDLRLRSAAWSPLVLARFSASVRASRLRSHGSPIRWRDLRLPSRVSRPRRCARSRPSRPPRLRGVARLRLRVALDECELRDRFVELALQRTRAAHREVGRFGADRQRLDPASASPARARASSRRALSSALVPSRSAHALELGELVVRFAQRRLRDGLRRRRGLELLLELRDARFEFRDELLALRDRVWLRRARPSACRSPRAARRGWLDAPFPRRRGRSPDRGCDRSASRLAPRSRGRAWSLRRCLHERGHSRSPRRSRSRLVLRSTSCSDDDRSAASSRCTCTSLPPELLSAAPRLSCRASPRAIAVAASARSASTRTVGELLRLACVLEQRRSSRALRGSGHRRLPRAAAPR